MAIASIVWFIAYSVASSLVLIWATLFVRTPIVAPVVAARRITIVPSTIRPKTMVDLDCIIHEIAVVKLGA